MKNQCLFCSSRRCHLAIYTESRSYDEVACSRHIHELEEHADKTLGVKNGVMRWHYSGTSLKSRAKKV